MAAAVVEHHRPLIRGRGAEQHAGDPALGGREHRERGERGVGEDVIRREPAAVFEVIDGTRVGCRAGALLADGPALAGGEDAHVKERDAGNGLIGLEDVDLVLAGGGCRQWYLRVWPGGGGRRGRGGTAWTQRAEDHGG